MGNFGRRTSNAMRSAIKATGVRLSVLPPYSPNVIPIGQALPGIKHWMHMARQRNMKDTWCHVGHLAGTISKDECAS